MDNLWTRRSNNSKISLSTAGSNSSNASTQDHPGRSYSSSRRYGENSGNNNKGQLNIPTSTASLTSPLASGSSAFGFGTGAFASFGTSKTPKAPSSTPDISNNGGPSKTSSTKSEDLSAELSKVYISDQKKSEVSSPSPTHCLRHNWAIWFRPPIVKSNGYVQYEKTLHPVACFGVVEDFLTVYRHLKRPSTLPPVSDYHIFKKGIRPVWEDDENKKGGKWIVRLKKGLADRYWEDLVFAIVGDQFTDASDEVCGAVLSVRNGEDILSIWVRNDGGKVLKIRETMKRILGFPPDTRVEWKSHDSSIQQRTAVDEHRKEKYNHHDSTHGRNRTRPSENFTYSLPEKK